MRQDIDFVKLTERISKIFAFLILFLGAIVLSGWIFKIGIFINIFPDLPVMSPNSAFNFIIISILILCLGKKFKTGGAILYYLSIGIIFSIGVLTTLEYVFRVNFGIDAFSVGFRDNFIRMSPQSAFIFIIIALLIFWVRREFVAKSYISQAIILIFIIIIPTPLLGYIYQIPALYVDFPLKGVSPYSATGFVLVLLAAIMRYPKKGIMGILTGNDLSGIIARRMFAIFVLLMVANYIASIGRMASVYGADWEMFFHAVLTALAFAFLLFSIIEKLRRRVVTAETQKDIIERHEIELRKFKLAADYVLELIIITDENGLVLYANPAAEKITGYPPEELIGAQAGRVTGGLMKKSFYKKMWKTIKTDKRTFFGEVVNRRKSGEKYEMSLIITPILNEAREVKFFVGLGRDITREKKIDKAKTEFVSLAAHQLNAPLTAIKWHIELLKEKLCAKCLRANSRFIKEISGSGQRMIDLVSALLNVSRIDLGEFSIESKPVDIKKIALDSLYDFAPQIKKKGQKLTKHFGKNFPKAHGDPNLLGIIFQNLISNAIKYTPAGGKISISAKVERGRLYISVSDNGYGIPQRQQPQIFTKLFRGDNIKEKSSQGTGLGLYVVKEIVDAIHGKIRFESKENKGTAFYVDLPLKMPRRKGRTALLKIA